MILTKTLIAPLDQRLTGHNLCNKQINGFYTNRNVAATVASQPLLKEHFYECRAA